MLQNINLTNAQEDTFQNACIAISYVEWEEVQAAVTVKRLTRTSQDNYELSEDKKTSEEDGISSIKFSADYWSNVQKMQQGCRPYILEGQGGQIEFVVEFDDQWIEKYNAIHGSDQQKAVKICELFLQEVVVPQLKA